MLQRVFVDSNVLVSRTCRDWLFLLRNELPGMYQVHSTFDVLVETVRAWRRLRRKDDGSAATRLFERLKESLDEVLEDFDGGIDFTGKDPDDSHVHAAAVAAGAHILLTGNGRDFGDPDQLPYELQSADEFFCLIDDGAPDSVRLVTMKQIAYWQSKDAAGRQGIVDALIAASCPMFAERVTAHIKTLGGPSSARTLHQGRR